MKIKTICKIILFINVALNLHPAEETPEQIQMQNESHQRIQALTNEDRTDYFMQLISNSIVYDNVNQKWDIIEENISMAKVFMQYGINVNSKNEYGRIPLHTAVYDGLTEIVRLLIEAGSDVNAIDNEGFTPLGFSGNMAKKDIIEMLKNAGAHYSSIEIDYELKRNGNNTPNKN